jgi:hypothetical protein
MTWSSQLRPIIFIKTLLFYFFIFLFGFEHINWVIKNLIRLTWCYPVNILFHPIKNLIWITSSLNELIKPSLASLAGFNDNVSYYNVDIHYNHKR